jgi:oxygen-dependent protoporphyrinogen oxidase
MSSQKICILGGGITGLSSAFYLSRRFPSAHIILLEKENRIGGWVQSERVQLPNNLGSVVLERGPRTLRPNGKGILELVGFPNLFTILSSS